MDFSPARGRTNTSARAYREMAYDPFSTVEIRQNQPSRGIQRGMTGVVLDLFGTPPTHYRVAITEAKGSGIFAAKHVRRPRERLPSLASPSAQAPSRTTLLEQVGYADLHVPVDATDTSDWLSASSCAHLRDQVFRALQIVPATLVDCYPHVAERYGPIFEATLTITGPNGRQIEMVAGSQFRKMSNGEISCTPRMLVPMPLRLVADTESRPVILGEATFGSDTKKNVAAPQGWYRLPREIWQKVIYYLSLEDLNTFSELCRGSQSVAHEECRRPKRSRNCFETLDGLMGTRWSRAIGEYCHLLGRMQGSFNVPKNTDAKRLIALARLIDGRRARGQIYFNSRDSEKHVHAIGPEFDVHWALDDWRSLLCGTDLPRLPASLHSLSLNLTSASSRGLRDLLNAMSEHTRLAVTMDAFQPSPGRLPPPAQGQLSSLCLPARTARGGHLSSWVSLPGLRYLTLLDEDDTGHLGRHGQAARHCQTITLPTSLQTLTCPPRMFAFFSGLENLEAISKFKRVVDC